MLKLELLSANENAKLVKITDFPEPAGASIKNLSVLFFSISSIIIFCFDDNCLNGEYLNKSLSLNSSILGLTLGQVLRVALV